MTTAAMSKRLAALEAVVPSKASDDLKEFGDALGVLIDALREMLPSDEVQRVDGGSHIRLHYPTGWRDHGKKLKEMARRLHEGATTADDVRLLDSLPTQALSIVAAAAGLPDTAAAVVVWMSGVEGCC